MPEKGSQKRIIPPAELAQNHGADGKPGYIAFEGKVYDISDSPLWEGGLHMERHRAGLDLTGEFPEAPHGREVFERYPQVGVLPEAGEMPQTSEEEAPAASRVREWWERVCRRAPLLKRHPHPMVVHFPIVFLLSTAFFTVLHLITGVSSFEATAFHCLSGGVLFTPVAMATGLLTWWFNYLAKPLRPVVLKLILSPLLLAAGAGAWVWRWLDPQILAQWGSWTGKVYVALICSLAPLVSLVGWYGASLTFPLHEE